MDDITKILENYDLPSTFLGAVRYGQGHINDTYCVVCQPIEGDCIRYILQGMSTVAFKEPKKLMENFISITNYLGNQIRRAGGDPLRETLSIIKTKSGQDFVTDENGKRAPASVSFVPPIAGLLLAGEVIKDLIK